MKKILAISSGGGHWIQLQRLIPAFSGHEIVWASVQDEKNAPIQGKYIRITDANFDTKMRLIKTFIEIHSVVKNTKPDVIITTGAAPGLCAIFWGYVFKKHTIWVDSIANAGRLSLSGKIAKRFAETTLTQWPHLANGKVMYKGSVI